jgi:oligoribonuclease (3'-5' exoribonuclease)
MSTQVITENSIHEAVLATINSPQKPNNKYRYYQCHHDWNGLKCKKVESTTAQTTKENTQLMFVNKYIPELLDKYVLKYKYIPDRVIIEK